MQIITNTGKVDIKDVRSNSGKIVDFVYMNKVLVWQRMITLTLPQYSKTFSLRSYINSNNPNNVKKITIINTRTQPSIETGNLSGFDVTFINNGEIQGTYPGSTALNITSKLKLLNNGKRNLK